MPIVLTEHAQLQIDQRGITKSDVLATVKNPDIILESFRSRKLRDKMIGSKMLRVVTVTEGSRISIVTAYYLR